MKLHEFTTKQKSEFEKILAEFTWINLNLPKFTWIIWLYLILPEYILIYFKLPKVY